MRLMGGKIGAVWRAGRGGAGVLPVEIFCILLLAVGIAPHQPSFLCKMNSNGSHAVRFALTDAGLDAIPTKSSQALRDITFANTYWFDGDDITVQD